MTKVLFIKFILIAWLIAVIINFIAVYKSKKEIKEISEETGISLRFIQVLCILICFLGPFAWFFGFINIEIGYKND